MSATLKLPHSYIDRKVAEGLFRELLGEKPPYRVLNLYGKNGMGKSRFSAHLEEKYLKNSKNIIYAKIDFENRLLHKPHKAIMYLAKELENRYDLNFMALWKAYAILWQKRYEHSPIMYAVDLPYFKEVKKLVSVDKKGNIIVEIAKGLFGSRVSKELEALKELDSLAIEASLYKFFAIDLRRIIKEGRFKDCVIIFDNVDLLKEHLNSTPCSKDEWIRELITNIGKDAMFVLFSQEDLNWKACNSAWRDIVKSYEVGKFSKKESLRYLSESGIKKDDLKEAICVSSGGSPFWLSLAKYAYFGKDNYTIPTTKKDIFNAFLESLNPEELKLLKIFAHTRFFNKNLAKESLEKFGFEYSDEIFKNLISKDYIKKISNDKYYIDTTLKDELISAQSSLEAADYKSFIFGYYDNLLQSLDLELIKNTPQVIDEVIEEGWHHLNLINDEPLVHFEWLDYYVARFFMYAAWEPFVDRYSRIIPKLKAAQDKVSKEKLVSLYNNLAGLYESLGETKKAKDYYKKVIEHNRPQLLSA